MVLGFDGAAELVAVEEQLAGDICREHAGVTSGSAAGEHGGNIATISITLRSSKRCPSCTERPRRSRPISTSSRCITLKKEAIEIGYREYAARYYAHFSHWYPWGVMVYDQFMIEHPPEEVQEVLALHNRMWAASARALAAEWRRAERASRDRAQAGLADAGTVWRRLEDACRHQGCARPERHHEPGQAGVWTRSLVARGSRAKGAQALTHLDPLYGHLHRLPILPHVPACLHQCECAAGGERVPARLGLDDVRTRRRDAPAKRRRHRNGCTKCAGCELCYADCVSHYRPARAIRAARADAVDAGVVPAPVTRRCRERAGARKSVRQAAPRTECLAAGPSRLGRGGVLFFAGCEIVTGVRKSRARSCKLLRRRVCRSRSSTMNPAAARRCIRSAIGARCANGLRRMSAIAEGGYASVVFACPTCQRTFAQVYQEEWAFPAARGRAGHTRSGSSGCSTQGNCACTPTRAVRPAPITTPARSGAPGWASMTARATRWNRSASP